MRSLAIFILAIGVFGLAAAVSAQGTTGGQTITIPNPLGACADIQCTLNQVLAVLVALATPVATIMVLVGAFQILTAGGNPEKFKKGRQTILYAAIGFAVVLLASSVSWLIQDLFNP